MVPVHLSLIDLPRLQPFTAAAEVYPPADVMTVEDWVAAGKPCMRNSCGHRHCDHIPSEAMECDSCDCLGFVGFAHPRDAAVVPSLAPRLGSISREWPTHYRGGR
jgi:hypothetical protein